MWSKQDFVHLCSKLDCVHLYSKLILCTLVQLNGLLDILKARQILKYLFLSVLFMKVTLKVFAQSLQTDCTKFVTIKSNLI